MANLTTSCRADKTARLSALSDGDRFHMAYPQGSGRINVGRMEWEARGNGWYGAPGGEDGGPWFADTDLLIVQSKGTTPS